MKIMMTAIAIASATVFLVVAAGIMVATAAGADALHPRTAPRTATARRIETTRILSILDRTVAGPMVLTRAAEKLVTLSDDQVHLMASLADRLTADGDRPAAGIALLLITALLIIS